MRRVVIGAATSALLATLVAGCSGPTEEGAGSMNAVEESADASPDIAPSAAPGVAFAYAYDYRLDDSRISAAQEAHAAACERLGLARCRITGLRYTIGEDEQVTAMLAVKLDPTIARGFGKQATATIAAAGGRLVNAEFTGEDEGSAIRTATVERRETQAQIAEIEKRLAALGAGDRERTALQEQLNQLRSSASETTRTISASEEKLASTPMTFNYYGKGGIPGFRGTNPFAEAWKMFIASGVTMISFLLTVIGAVLPWAVVLLLIVLALRSRIAAALVRWWRRDTTE